MHEEKHHSDMPDPNEFDGSTELDPEVEFRSAFSETLTQHGFPDTLVLSRDRADDVFHERRLKIMDYLKTHDPDSVRALAKALELDKGVVSRDLQKLAEVDIISFEASGRSKSPRLKHEHAVVEPLF